MPREEKITCDQCGEDITTTNNCVNYRLVVSSQSMPNPSNFATSMHIEDPLKQPKYFCGWGCIDQFFAARLHNNLHEDGQKPAGFRRLFEH